MIFDLIITSQKYIKEKLNKKIKIFKKGKKKTCPLSVLIKYKCN